MLILTQSVSVGGGAECIPAHLFYLLTICYEHGIFTHTSCELPSESSLSCGERSDNTRCVHGSFDSEARVSVIILQFAFAMRNASTLHSVQIVTSSFRLAHNVLIKPRCVCLCIATTSAVTRKHVLNVQC